MKAVLSLNLKRIVIDTWICVIPILVSSFKYSKDGCLMLSKKEKAEHKAKPEEDSDEEPQTYVNKLLHSLLYNCEVYFNNTRVYLATGLYHHKAQISNELNSSAVSNNKILACHGYSFEEYPDAFDMHPLTDGAN